ncbi:hypothetical protein QUA40_20140 [Microcoleus sp. Pol11C3]
MVRFYERFLDRARAVRSRNCGTAEEKQQQSKLPQKAGKPE